MHYQAHCWATELNGPESRIIVKDADVCVDVMLPYVRKVVPLEQPATRTMWSTPDMLYFTESKTNLKYIFIVTEAK